MKKTLKKWWKQLRCKHDYRIGNILWDGDIDAVCVRCRKHKVVRGG